MFAFQYSLIRQGSKLNDKPALSHLSQVPVCSTEQLQCVKNISVDNTGCQPMCEGLIVTSYSRAENQMDLEKYISLVGKDYDNYKTFVKYPASIKGW